MCDVMKLRCVHRRLCVDAPQLTRGRTEVYLRFAPKWTRLCADLRVNSALQDSAESKVRTEFVLVSSLPHPSLVHKRINDLENRNTVQAPHQQTVCVLFTDKDLSCLMTCDRVQTPINKNVTSNELTSVL